MLLGLFILFLGCYILGCNEDLHYTKDRLVQRAVSELERLPCKPASSQVEALQPSNLVFLDSCPLKGGRLSFGSPDLKALQPFETCFPKEGVHGAWLAMHVQEYDGSGWDNLGGVEQQSARSEAFSPKPYFILSSDVFVADFRLGARFASWVPGTMATLHCVDEVQTTAGFWSPQEDSMLYNANPANPVKGDLRIWFSIGDLRHISILGSVTNGTLLPWHASEDVVNVRVTMPAIAGLKAGPVSLRSMLQKALPRLHVEVWTLRGVGFLVVWLALSLLLFPNHCPPCIRHEDGWGCFKSLALAIPPSVVTILASQCYLRIPLEATVCTVLLLPLLVALSWGCEVDASSCWCCRRSRQHNENEVDYAPVQDMESHEVLAAARWAALREKAIRIVALSIGLGLAVAGPAVRAFAAIDIFGFYIYAWATTVPNG